MLTVSPTALEAARSGSATPCVRIRLANRDLGVARLRFARWSEGSEAAGPAAVAIGSDGALIRARIDASADTLHLQRVATPTSASAYDTWTSMGSAEATAGLGLHAAGARVLLAYDDGGDLCVRESTDDGATFASAVTVATVGSVVTLACGIREDGAAVLVWAVGGTVYRASRPAAGAWGSPAAWSHTLATVNALALGDAEDWAILVSGTDGDGVAGCWSTRLGSGVGGPPGHWSTLRPVALASPDLDVTYRATAVAIAGAPRAALVESFAGTGAFHRALLATALAGATFEDGDWREPVPFPHTSAWGVTLAARDGEVFATSADGVWHASIDASPIDVTAGVVAATYEADHASERLALTLDGTTLDAILGEGVLGEGGLPLLPGIEVEYAPGYEVGGDALVTSGRALWVTGATRAVRDGRAIVEIEAIGAIGWLARWRASRLTSSAAGERSVLASVREVARLASVRVSADGASDAVTTLTPGFTLRPGEAAMTAIGRLIARTPDLLVGRGAEVIVFEPDPNGTPSCEYGDGSEDHHPRSVALHARREAAAAVRVIGLGAVGEAAGDVDDAGASDGAILTVVDEGLTTAEQATGRAAAVLRRARLASDLATIEAAPHPGLEPGDLVAVTHATLNLDATPFRVRSVRIEFSRSPRGRYVMRLGLGAP